MRWSAIVALGVLSSGALFLTGCGPTRTPVRAGPPPVVIGPGKTLLRISAPVRYGPSKVSVAYSPDGRTLAVGRLESSGSVVSLIDTATWQERATLHGAKEHHYCGFAFSQDGQSLAVVDEDSIKHYDPEIGLLRSQLVDDDARFSQILRYQRDGRKLFASTELCEVIVRDVSTGQVAAKWDIPTRSIEDLAVSPDGRTVAIASPGPMRCRTFLSWNGFGVACGTGPRIVRLYDAATGKLKQDLGRDGTACCIAFSPDGKSLASGAGDEARLRNLDSDNIQTIVDTQEGLLVECVAWSSDGQTVAVGLGNQPKDEAAGEVHLWDVATARVRTVLRGDVGPVLALAFSPDGHTLVTAGGPEVRLWDLSPTGKATDADRVP